MAPKPMHEILCANNKYFHLLLWLHANSFLGVDYDILYHAFLHRLAVQMGFSLNMYQKLLRKISMEFPMKVGQALGKKTFGNHQSVNNFIHIFAEKIEMNSV